MAVVLMAGVSASAQTEMSPQDIFTNLRAQHQELKVQVDAGEITREEARSTWQAVIAEARAAADVRFAEHMSNIQAKVEQISEKNSERATELQTQVEAAVEHRDSIKGRRAAIFEQVKGGEINREEAKEMNSEIRTEQEAYRATLQVQREERQVKIEEFKAQRAERQANRPQVSE